MVLPARYAAAALVSELMGSLRNAPGQDFNLGQTGGDDSQGKRKISVDEDADNVKKKFPEAGFRGFLCTFETSARDPDVDVISLLRYFAEFMYGPEADSGAGEKRIPPYEDGVDLRKEIAKMKAVPLGKNPRFLELSTGVKNVMFYKSRLQNPWEIATTIYEEVINSRQQIINHLTFFIPIEVTCVAVKGAIVKNITKLLFPDYFEFGPKTYAVVARCVNNDDFTNHALDLIVMQTVKEKFHDCQLDVNDPTIHVFVQVIGDLCYLSILKHYKRYHEYELTLLARYGAD